MSHEPFDTHAAAYALGALDGQDLAEFEAHLAHGCDQCVALLREVEESLAALALQAAPAMPPPEVKAALMRRLAPAPVSIERPRQRWLPWAAFAAAAMLLAVLSALLVTGHDEERMASLEREVSALREQVRRQEASLREGALPAGALALLADPVTTLVTLRGAGPSPDATGRVVWHEREGGWLIASNLPPAEAGKTYELWTIRGGKPAPAGLFEVDRSGVAVRRVEPAGGPVDVFAVTLEPAGGVASPTGPIVLASAK
jgi:anti-sigma-K factor RskA